jgi:hypothetical protein
MTQLWYTDSVNAVNAERYQDKARNWRDAHERLKKVTSGDADAQPQD